MFLIVVEVRKEEYFLRVSGAGYLVHTYRSRIEFFRNKSKRKPFR